MDSSRPLLTMLFLLGSGYLQAQQPSSATRPPAAISVDAIETPASQRLVTARHQVAAHPHDVQAINEVASASLRRARETGQATYLRQAADALAIGLRLEPANFQLQKTRIALLLATAHVTEAREQAAALNRQTPDDVMLYGYLAEAGIALGDYAEAERATQWMLNMRPNNVPGLLLGATLRQLYGDTEGAVDLLNLAFSETPPAEIEELAFIANRIASVLLDSGKTTGAIGILDRAAQIFPGYPATLANQARVALAQQHPDAAVPLLRQALALTDAPDLAYQLAQAQRAAGQTADALRTETDFRKLVAADSFRTPQISHDLVLLLAASPATREEALVAAERETSTHHDVLSDDALGWALYVNGRYPEAGAALQNAIAVGIQSAEIFDQAGRVAEKLGHAEEASRNFQLAREANPGTAADARPPVLVQPLPPSPSPGPQLAAAPPGNALAPAPVRSPVAFSPVPVALLTPRPTSTERQLQNAQALVRRNLKDAKAYASLGAAYVQHARETGDVGDYQLAEQALTHSLTLDSADFAADATFESMAELSMGEHRFDDALSYANRALSLGSGDLSPFALVGDANADMGEYDKASLAYARLTPAGLPLSAHTTYVRDSRVSYLTFIGGDTAAAIVQMQGAVTEGIEAQLPQENLAWLYFELGEYLTQAGDADAANTAYLTALNTHPGDYRALAGLARLRANHGREAEAITLYQSAIAVVPMPTFIAELGDLYTRIGNPVEAKKQYALVEYIGTLGRINQVLHNRDLALFDADHDQKLPEALALAKKEFEVRHDIYTWDTLAWVQYKNGNLTEASEASRQALRFGTRDALLLFHAGMIAGSLGQTEQARRDLAEALRINPHFHLVDARIAQERLRLLQPQTASNAKLAPNAP